MINSKKKLFFSFVTLCASSLLAQNHPYFVSDNHGYIQKNRLDITLSSMLMNDSVDILKLKDGEVDSSTQTTALGDLDGHELALRYKLYDDAMLGVKYQKTNLNYGLGELTNQKVDIYLKHNFISKSFAIDIGVQTNKADDINSDAIKNKILTEVEKRKLITMSNNPFYGLIPSAKKYIITDSNNETFKNDNGDDITVQTNSNNIKNFLNSEIINEVTLKNMKDTSYYIKATRSFVEDDIFSKDFYVGYAYTKIDSYLDITIQQNKDLTTVVENKLKTYKDLQDLNRDEHKLLLGVNYSWFVNHWYMDLGYEFNYIKRDKGLDEYNTNHKLTANLGYEILPNTIVYIGAKIMSNQFAGEIPYLYNQYTQSSFDKKYGWAKAGLLIKF